MLRITGYHHRRLRICIRASGWVFALIAGSVVGRHTGNPVPDFHRPYGKLFLGVILCTATLIGWRRPEIRWHEGVLFLVGLAAALLSARHITVFAVISVPWIGVWMTRTIDRAAASGSSVARSLQARGTRLMAVSAMTGPESSLTVAGVGGWLAPWARGPKRASFDRVGAEMTSWKTSEPAQVKGTNDMFQRHGRGDAP